MGPVNSLWDLQRRGVHPLLIVFHHRGEQNEFITAIPNTCVSAHACTSIN